jgi:hypothetical protein
MFIKIDLCIVMDVTGSMRPWLEEAKHRIGSLVEEIPKTVKSIKGKDVVLRFAFVAYRDLPEHPVVCDFETDISRIKEKIFAINAGGGGDIPEDVHGALEAVRMLAWAEAGQKILVHILDAPPHGSAFHDLRPEDDERFGINKPTMDFVKSFAEDKISYVMLRCGRSENIHNTSKFASLCDLKYSEEARRLREMGAAGKLPFFKHIELENSENVVSQFLPILIRTTTGAVNNKPLTIVPGNDIPKPTAPEAPVIAQVLKGPPYD